MRKVFKIMRLKLYLLRQLHLMKNLKIQNFKGLTDRQTHGCVYISTFI